MDFNPFVAKQRHPSIMCQYCVTAKLLRRYSIHPNTALMFEVSEEDSGSSISRGERVAEIKTDRMEKRKYLCRAQAVFV